MCGYAVVISKYSNVVSSALKSFDKDLSHRGPDDSGEMQVKVGSKYIGFGHRRLSILDLTSKGKQPIQDSISGNIIVFNGEIYNFISLKDSLKSLGETFKSNSDTEVILELIVQYGFRKALDKIIGMFSLLESHWVHFKTSLEALSLLLGINDDVKTYPQGHQ